MTSFNSATDNITYIPKNTRDSYVESYFLSVQKESGQEHPARRGLRRKPRRQAAGLPQRQSEEPGATVSPGPTPTGRPTSPRRSTSSIPTTTRCRCGTSSASSRGLTLLNSFTWEHSLDNASASLEGNTPSPQNGNNIRADYAQSDYNLPDRQHHQPGLRTAFRSRAGSSWRVTTRW